MRRWAGAARPSSRLSRPWPTVYCSAEVDVGLTLRRSGVLMPWRRKGTHMASVIRLIWRLDHPLSYNFMDKLGTVRKIITDTAPKFWQNVADGNLLYSFTADYLNNETGAARNMTAELQSLNGELRWRTGTDLPRVFQTDEFRNIDRIVRELMRVLEIREMRRAGIRFQGMGRFADGKGGGFRRFTSLVSRDFVGNVEAALRGKNEDLGIQFNGKTEDEIHYRIVCGPAARTDFATVFSQAAGEKEAEMLKQFDFSYDIDLFEFDTSFVEHNLFRWATTKLEKAVALVAGFEKLA